MKERFIFALYGPANVGKSTTIKKVFALLKKANPTAPIRTLNSPGIDITLIIEINGVSIGVETEGDPNGRLAESLEQLKISMCSIMICATRTRGSTVTFVESFQPDFKVVWRQKISQPQAAFRERHDDETAQAIFADVNTARAAELGI